MNRRRSANGAAACLRRFFRNACSASVGAAWLVLSAPAGAAAKDIHTGRPSEPASEQAAVEEARALVQELLALRPAENAVQDGVLRIWDGRKLRAVVPVRCSVFVTPTNWLSVYETLATNASAHDLPLADAPRSDAACSDAATVHQRLTVLHCEHAPNTYALETRRAATVERRTLSGEELMQPFANSDFWFADLGLEFLHWPEQKVLRREMKRGQSCVVLESRRPGPATNGYARVISWIDRDTGGIVQAEAFDARERKLKEFAPKSFKKVNGQWQLQEMEIRNLQTGGRTRLEFALPDSPTVP